MEKNIIAFKDFDEEELKAQKNREFEEHIKDFYHGDFYIDSKIIMRNGKQFLRLFVIAGKY